MLTTLLTLMVRYLILCFHSPADVKNNSINELLSLLGYCSGEQLGFESLVYGVFEFIHAMIDSSKFRSVIKKSMQDLLYYVILYMQMTGDQVTRLSSIEKNRTCDSLFCHYIKAILTAHLYLM